MSILSKAFLCTGTILSLDPFPKHLTDSAVKSISSTSKPIISLTRKPLAYAICNIAASRIASAEEEIFNGSSKIALTSENLRTVGNRLDLFGLGIKSVGSL